MIKTIAFILLRLIATLLAVTFLTFAMVALLPGDPVDTILGTSQRDPAVEQQIREDLNLDDPFVVRYFTWLGNAVTGDLGDVVHHRPASGRHHQPTCAGHRAARVHGDLHRGGHRHSRRRAGRLQAIGWQDTTSSAAVQVALSIPNFIVGIFLIWLFAVQLNWLPSSNWSRLSDGVVDNLKTSILPSVALALGAMALFSRLIRSDMVATLKEDYILSARAKGLSDRYILFRHALRPSSLSLMTVVGISFGALLGGTVVIETLFAIPGLGFSLINAINARDILLIQGITVFIAVMFVIINTVVDLLYVVLDPRIRRS